MFFIMKSEVSTFPSIDIKISFLSKSYTEIIFKHSKEFYAFLINIEISYSFGILIGIPAPVPIPIPNNWKTSVHVRRHR